MEYFKLEGPALDAFYRLIDNVKKEAARVNNMDLNTAWGPNGALELLQLLPANLGRATLTSTTHYGYRYSTGIGATQGLINLAPVPANRVIGIWGFVDTSPMPIIDQLNITIGTRLSRNWPTKEAQSEMNNKADRLDPIIIPSSKNLVITVACHQANWFELTWLGVWAQPKS